MAFYWTFSLHLIQTMVNSCGSSPNTAFTVPSVSGKEIVSVKFMDRGWISEEDRKWQNTYFLEFP